MAEPVQTKLTVNTPGDAYKQEADRVAAQVMWTNCSGLVFVGASCSVAHAKRYTGADESFFWIKSQRCNGIPSSTLVHTK